MGTPRASPTSLTPLSPTDVLRFDNTYSFLHSKKVSYSVEVLLPDTQQIQGESPNHSP